MSDDAKVHVELEDGVSEPAHKMGGALGKLLGFFEKLDDAGESLHRAMEFAFGGILEDAIEKVGEFGKEIIVGTVEMAAFGQEAEEAFKNITGSAALGEEALERARGVSERLGLDIKSTASTMEQFMRLGFSSAQAEGMVKMGADLRTVGVEAGKVDGIMSALTRMQARGVMDSRAMLELAGAGVQTHNVYARLADQLGTTEGAVKKMGESGKISAAQAIGAIQGELLGKLGETAFGEKAAQSADETLDGLKRKMAAQLQGLQMDIGKAIAPSLTAALQTVSEEITTFIHSADGAKAIESLKSIVIAMGDGVVFLAKHLPEIVDGIKLFWGAISPVIDATGYLIDGIMAMAKALGQVLAPMMPYIKWALENIGVPALKVFLGFVALLTGTLLLAVAPFIALGAAVTHWGDTMEWVQTKLAQFRAYLASFSLFQAGADMINGLVAGIESIIPKVEAAARKLANIPRDVLASVLKMHSPSLVMAELGGFAAEGFGQGIESGTRHVETAAAGMANAAVAPVGGAKGGGAGNTIHFSPEIHVSAGPGANHEDAERMGSHLEPVIERQFMSLLEGLSLSAV